MPRPRLNLIRFHGVLAPNAKIRSGIIPGRTVSVNDTSDDLDGSPHHSTSVRVSWARLLKRVFDIDIEHPPAVVYNSGDSQGMVWPASGFLRFR